MSDPDSTPLEDDQNDVLNKAAAHYGISSVSLPVSSSEALRAYLKDRLHLDPSSYLNMPSAIPALPLPPNLHCHARPFGGWTVNIWTIETPTGIIAVDTGCSPADLMAVTDGIPPQAILVTHSDHDHAGGLGAFPNTPVFDARNLQPGKTYEIGSLTWTIHDLSGHTDDSIGFETELGGQKVFFPGDSIFARSIGKSRMPIETTISNILKALHALSPDTIICPGHGPATTVEAERRSNPFLAHFF